MRIAGAPQLNRRYYGRAAASRWTEDVRAQALTAIRLLVIRVLASRGEYSARWGNRCLRTA